MLWMIRNKYQVIELGFETKNAALLYVMKFGNPSWIVFNTVLLSASDVKEMEQ